MKNGLRKCEVVFKDLNKMNKTLTDLHFKLGIAGIGRVHIKNFFSHPILVPNGYSPLYEELVNSALESMVNNKIFLSHTTYNESEYLVMRSSLKQ